MPLRCKVVLYLDLETVSMHPMGYCSSSRHSSSDFTIGKRSRHPSSIQSYTAYIERDASCCKMVTEYGTCGDVLRSAISQVIGRCTRKTIHQGTSLSEAGTENFPVVCLDSCEYLGQSTREIDLMVAKSSSRLPTMPRYSNTSDKIYDLIRSDSAALSILPNL